MCLKQFISSLPPIEMMRKRSSCQKYLGLMYDSCMLYVCFMYAICMLYVCLRHYNSLDNNLLYAIYVVMYAYSYFAL